MDFICYIGKDRVGKTTMAESLQRLLNSGCKKVAIILSLADTLRYDIIDTYGIPESIIFDKSIDKKNFMITLGDYLYDGHIVELWRKYKLIDEDQDFDSITLSLRDLLVNHGEKIRRVMNTNYFIDGFNQRLNTIKKSIQNTDDLVIINDDIRNPNDFPYFEEQGACFYNVFNNAKTESNELQDKVVLWIEDNLNKITKHILLPIPLLQYTADRENMKYIIPKILPRVPRKSVYFEWS